MNMNVYDKERLEILRSFTYYITGECPRDVIKCAGTEECGKIPTTDECLSCWRSALTERIEQLSK